MAKRLNVCCGGRILDGYVNIDIVAAANGTKPDILADARKVPLPSNCADEVLCVHGLEHFVQWQADELVEEWKRLLKPGGLLVLELPDLMKCCQNIVSGFTEAGKHPDQSGIWGLYGDYRGKQEFMTHRFGYTPKSLRELLKAHGFIDIEDQETRWHPVGRKRRDMRMEARKPVSA